MLALGQEGEEESRPGLSRSYTNPYVAYPTDLPRHTDWANEEAIPPHRPARELRREQECRNMQRPSETQKNRSRSTAFWRHERRLYRTLSAPDREVLLGV